VSKTDDAYEQILSKSEPELRELYPFGIVREGNKWVRAKRGEGERKLSRLLADKEARQVEPPMMKVGSGYTTNPKYALGKDRRHTGEEGEAEPASPYPDEMKRLRLRSVQRYRDDHSEELARTELRSVMGRQRQLAIQFIREGKSAGEAWQAATLEIMREELDANKAA
jgi:hypothetical protein